MIEIKVTDKVNEKIASNLPELKKIEGIVLYCEPSMFKYTEDSAYTETDRKFSRETGYHYVIDGTSIEQYIPDNRQTKHLNNGKPTFIERALYQGKTNEKTISVLMLIPEDEKYENVERRTIKFIANFLVEKQISPDDLMRGFDLNKLGSPLHLVDKTKWRKFIKLLTDTYEDMKVAKENNENYSDKPLEEASTTYSDKAVRKFYLDNGELADEYVEDFEPDHRDIKKITEYKSSEASEIKMFTSSNNTNFTYTVVENMSSASHCSRAFDTVTSKAEPNTLDVEPVYPDLAVPPGGTLTFVDSVSSAVNTFVSSAPLSSEEFENRQQSFNVNDYKDAVKKNEGKPVNNNDPFPVDDKIKELESHMPKVKIDEVAFTLHDCNHPDSIIGPAVAQNFAMVQDEIITLAKRTERRLVKLENTISTIMRNLFRVSSRMQVNCVYYGGQDVYGKYKCIRCLHNDRINDGQSMTLDQCLSCTRYEPIIGQIYAILDESGTNIAQVLDDMQMSYMSLDEYSNFTRNDIHNARKSAKVTSEGEAPKQFSEIWDEGFKMDWNSTPLETQRPNIAEYKSEGIEAVKPKISKENEPIIEDEFKESINDDEAYEVLKYDSNNYKFEGFGSYSTVSSLNLSGGGSEIRNKIVEYAQKGFDLCKEGKGRYTMNTDQSKGPTRYNHDDKAVNGVHYWDCSSFTEAAYKYAGITSIAGNTSSEYPKCLPLAGGIIMSIEEEDKALPGDLVWFTSQKPKPSSQEELAQAVVSQIGHVGIYIGNGEYINASTDNAPPTEQIKKSPTKNWDSRIFAFGRPKELVEADKKASEISSAGDGFFDYEAQQFSAEVTQWASQYCEGEVESTLKSLNTYGYKSTLIETSKKYELDPYLVLGIIATESAGDPTNRTGNYWGIMQTHKNLTRATGNLEDIKHDIELGCSHFRQMEQYLDPDFRRLDLITLSYNSGQVYVMNGCREYGDFASAPHGVLAPIIAKHSARIHGPGKIKEVSSYVAKVILRANGLRAKKALD